MRTKPVCLLEKYVLVCGVLLYEFRSDEAGQFNLEVENIKIRNVHRRALSVASPLLLFATVVKNMK